MSHTGMRRMVSADLEHVLAWRNRPEVRQFMYTQHEISLEEHARWFERASQAPRRHLLVYECEGRPCGFVNLGESAGGVAEWGFYTDPNAPRGTGMGLGRHLLDYAFSELGMHKVVGQVLAFNERSRHFHLRLGFQQEGILREQHYDGTRYHDVFTFGLLAREWPPQTPGESA